MTTIGVRTGYGLGDRAFAAPTKICDDLGDAVNAVLGRAQRGAEREVLQMVSKPIPDQQGGNEPEPEEGSAAGEGGVGRLIAQARRSRRLTLERLAGMAGCGRSYLSMIERGVAPRVPPSYSICTMMPRAAAFTSGSYPSGVGPESFGSNIR